GMDVEGEGRKREAPWKKMSKEELENQYSPSRWVVRLGAEEALRTFFQIGKDDYFENNLPGVLVKTEPLPTCTPTWEVSLKSLPP
uniref:Arylformamidase n=1 Tax=Catagonus wagneri TaxID=51154 RepID=A0A8C3X5Y9_9CETA